MAFLFIPVLYQLLCLLPAPCHPVPRAVQGGWLGAPAAARCPGPPSGGHRQGVGHPGPRLQGHQGQPAQVHGMPLTSRLSAPTHPWCRVFGMMAGVRRTHQRVVHSVSMVGGGLTLLHQGKVGKGASWCMVLGAWCMVHGVWCKELWCMVPQVEASCWWRRRNRSGELRVRVEVAVHWDRRGRVHLQGVGGRGLRRVACDPASMLVAQVGRDYHHHTTTTTLPHHHHHHHHHHPGINICIDQSKCDYL